MAYNDVIINQEPIAYWRLGEASGVSAIDETTSTDGTYVNTPTLGEASLLINDVDTAVGFDAINNEYMAATNQALFNQSHVTISAIIQITEWPSVTETIVAFTDGYGTALNDKRLDIQSDGKIVFYVLDGATKYAISTNTIPLNTPVHIVGVIDGEGFSRVYINGVEDGSIATTSSFTGFTNATICVGGIGGIGNDFTGIVDEVAIWSRGMSAHEIFTQYIHSKAYRGYSNLVMKGNPLGYYRLGEASGSDVINEAGSNNGTYIGTPTLGVDGAISGDDDTAAVFSLNNHANIGTIPEIEADVPFSIEMWVKTSDTGSSSYISNWSSAGFHIGQDNAGDIEIYLTNAYPSNLIYLTNCGVVSDNLWHHLLFTYDGSKSASGCDFYIDGVPIAFTVTYDSLTLNFTGTTSFNIGNRGVYSSGYEFQGSMDEVALYTHKLTPREVANHYYMGTTHANPLTYTDEVMRSMPLSYWRLGESAGPTAVDEVGNYAGTYIGAPTFNVTGAITNDADTCISTSDNNYVNCGVISEIEYNVPFSIEMWVKSGVSGTNSFIGNWVSGAGGFYIGQDGSGNIGVYMANTWTSNAIFLTNCGTIHDGNWHQIIFTYDGSTNASGCDFYIDGISQVYTIVYDSLNASIDKGEPLFLGELPSDVGYEFQGSMDEVALYTHKLSEYEIQRHYHKGKDTLNFDTFADEQLLYNPLAYWRLGETGVSLFADEIGTNPLTAVGTLNSNYIPGEPSLIVSDDIDTSLRLPDTTGYLHNDATSLSTLVKAFEVKFKIHSLNTICDLLSIYNDDNNRVIFQVRTDGKFSIELSRFGATATLTGDEDIQLDREYHVCVYYDSAASVTRFVINGVGQSTVYAQDVFDMLSTNPRLHVGAYYLTGAPVIRGDLTVDEMVIYDYEPTLHEIYERYFISIILNTLTSWNISGITKVSDVLESCTVRLYLRSDGELLSEQASDGVDGTYSFIDLIEGVDYDVVCISDAVGICPQIAGPLNPIL